MTSIRSLVVALTLCVVSAVAAAQTPWTPDLGDGSYKNPVLNADYSDPDAVRVGGDFWLTSSSFHHVPGLPILHSRDLVNWTLVNHALPRLVPEDHFATVHPGEGVWAPSIRFHEGKYWIYYPDPDFGIYVITAKDPAGAWSKPVLVKAGKGLIDPCPLWDDDGSLYLVHGWARSRSGRNNVLTLLRLSADGTRAVDAGRDIVDGNAIDGMHTLEGPKFYKLRGWYYIFAPVGGVTGGTQAVFRARRIEGPYEHRIVMAQGSTSINGPHQGALIDTPSGEWWFLHFQDKGAYGRVVHLQPVAWKDDWPVIGDDPANSGTGQPVLTHKKPSVAGRQTIAVPATSDEFDGPKLGSQWQWQANPKDEWYSLTARPGFLRVVAMPPPQGSLHLAPNLLLQKFPAPEFTVTAAVDFTQAASGDSTGLIVYGDDYAWIGLRRTAEGLRIVEVVNNGAAKQGTEREVASKRVEEGSAHPVWPKSGETRVGQPGTALLRLIVTDGARCRFSYSIDGKTFTPFGDEFTAVQGRWVGAKFGVFAASSTTFADARGHADFDWVRVGPAAQ